MLSESLGCGGFGGCVTVGGRTVLVGKGEWVDIVDDATSLEFEGGTIVIIEIIDQCNDMYIFMENAYYYLSIP